MLLKKSSQTLQQNNLLKRYFRIYLYRLSSYCRHSISRNSGNSELLGQMWCHATLSGSSRSMRHLCLQNYKKYAYKISDISIPCKILSISMYKIKFKIVSCSYIGWASCFRTQRTTIQLLKYIRSERSYIDHKLDRLDQLDPYWSYKSKKKSKIWYKMAHFDLTSKFYKIFYKIRST